MAILPLAYCESLKRYWRRRKYKRINGAAKRKLHILRLGGAASPRRRLWRIRRRNTKLHLEAVSPIKLLAKFNEAYVGIMIFVAKKMANPNSNGKKKVAKDRHVKLVSSGEEVDSKFLVEIYKKFAASRQLRTDL